MARCYCCDKIVCITVGTKTESVPIGHIVCCEKDRGVTKIITNDRAVYDPCVGLLSFGKKLCCCPFVLISASGVINFRYFEEYKLIKGVWRLYLENNIELIASGEGIKRINKELKKHTVIDCVGV